MSVHGPLMAVLMAQGVKGYHGMRKKKPPIVLRAFGVQVKPKP